MKFRLRLLVVPAVICLLAAGCTSGMAVVYSSATAIARTGTNPGANPPGANDWNCQPSSAHPQPVVLVHGTFANMTVNWNTLSPLLKNNGYCVFAFNYGGLIAGQLGGTGSVVDSAGQLSTFVNQVRACLLYTSRCV